MVPGGLHFSIANLLSCRLPHNDHLIWAGVGFLPSRAELAPAPGLEADEGK